MGLQRVRHSLVIEQQRVFKSISHQELCGIQESLSKHCQDLLCSVEMEKHPRTLKPFFYSLGWVNPLHENFIYVSLNFLLIEPCK